MSDSLQPHGLQHARLPCPSPSPGVCPSSCPLNWSPYILTLILMATLQGRKYLLFGRKAMAKWDSLLKNRDITLLTKVSIFKAMFFPAVMCRCESWSINKAECQRTNVFKLWFWRRLLRIPWPARRSNQSTLRESTLNIHWKNFWWSWSSNTLATWCEELTYWKRPPCWERLRAEEEGGGRGWGG